MLVVAVTVAAIVLVPKISESNRERSAQERRDAAAALAERRQRLIAEQRPAPGAAPSRSPHGAAVLAELRGRHPGRRPRARAAAGELQRTGGPKRVDVRASCRSATRVPRAFPFDCIAVTSDLPTSTARPGGVIGHPFRAVADFSEPRV